jgi:hypothetical protein
LKTAIKGRLRPTFRVNASVLFFEKISFHGQQPVNIALFVAESLQVHLMRAMVQLVSIA